jgi:hypothetical protein
MSVLFVSSLFSVSLYYLFLFTIYDLCDLYALMISILILKEQSRTTPALEEHIESSLRE